MKNALLTSIFATVIFVSTAASASVFAAMPNSHKSISESDAKQIVLEDAGMDENDVTFTKVLKDGDDGILEYEIDFNNGQVEFEYDLDAKTGDILLSERNEMDAEDIRENGISKEEALEIALKDAGLSDKDITCSEVEKDDEGGNSVYSVELRKGMSEYNYDISAKNGQIFGHEIDMDA